MEPTHCDWCGNKLSEVIICEWDDINFHFCSEKHLFWFLTINQGRSPSQTIRLLQHRLSLAPTSRKFPLLRPIP